MPTDIQAAIDVLYNELEKLENKMIEDHYFTNDQADQLELLVAKAIKFGELVNKRDSQGSNIILRESDIDKALASNPTAVQDLINHVQDTLITKALTRTHGNATKASRILGWNRGTVAKRIKRKTAESSNILFEKHFKTTDHFDQLQKEYPELEIFEMNNGKYELDEVQKEFKNFTLMKKHTV